jgi:uncharacterized cupredoxin-like copper-binding protein
MRRPGLQAQPRGNSLFPHRFLMVAASQLPELHMAISFQHHHGAMLLKYAGISFISGAVNHGFFSGTRSLWTAAIGILLFVLGAWLEHRLTDSDSQSGSKGLAHTLVWGTLLSIGLGFFTGGLQHFPDSPARSAWVVPLGFAISVLALSFSSSQPWQSASTTYTLVLGTLVCAFSFSAYRWLDTHPGWADGDHSHSAPTGLVSQTISRSIEVRMDDAMRFTPDKMDVKPGEVIRFVIHNDGKTPHEFVLGTAQDIAAHAKLMQQGATQTPEHEHEHGGGGPAISVAPGGIGELVVTFPEATQLQMACLIPGHFEAGMRGVIQVSDASPSMSSTPSSTPAPAASHAPHHDAGGHKH